MSSKVLIAILGLDQHEVGAMAVASALRDAGMEVVYTGRFNLPSAILQSAVQEDVDLVALSAHSWEYLEYIDEVLALLKDDGLDSPVVVGGSVITPDDEKVLLGKGVAGAFGYSWSMG
ncbi:MAG: methylmalonyl-CoA mutase, partial [bacterium]|nr:methylmalonyl-CoA mutase [bacterium]